VRLLDDPDAAHAELDRVLATELPLSARNQFFEQRRGIARSLPERLRSRLAGAAELRAALLRKPDFDLAYELVQATYDRPIVHALHGPDRLTWWCAFSVYGQEGGVTPPRPPFLPGDNEAEMEKLDALGSGASWILRTTLARAKSHPDDPRVPEALALAIEETRWACGDRETDALAEKAFGVLKRRYAKTKWAKQTRYWYRAGRRY
jgi:hypothetical protein